MNLIMKKNSLYILIFLGLAVLILWQALLPGYILGLDMVFAPEMKVLVNPDGFLNFLPVGYLIYWLGLIIPVWLVQKIILLVLFFSIGYLAFKYLPVGENKTARIFSALIYLANPFVYSRFLAGQWTHLMAYAFLPLFIHCLFVFKEKNGLKSCLKLFGTLFLISVFSIHFFAMSVMILAVWFIYSFIKNLVSNNKENARAIFKNVAICGVLFLIVSSYWLVPALSRPEPIEQRFDLSHWQAFSAGGYKNISPILNIVSLNGFWGERNPWARYFLWPQDYSIFWISFSAIMIFVLIGVISGFKKREKRTRTVFFFLLGIFALIFSTGVGETIFKNLNAWLFEHIFFWSGFRDSQKFSGFLALSYAFFAGLGLTKTIDFIDRKKASIKDIFSSLVFLMPIFFGFLVWGGFHKQIQPVWYPESWAEARQVIESDKSDFQVLFLPWHGYFSLKFNNKIISSNPAKRFFGDKIIASKNVELDKIYDQEEDRDYQELDSIIRNINISIDDKISFLQGNNIKYIIYVRDMEEVDSLSYDFLSSPKFEKNLEKDSIAVYKIIN